MKKIKNPFLKKGPLTSCAVAFFLGVVSCTVFFENNKQLTITDVQSHIQITPCFTPQKKCLPLILDTIENARSSIFVQGYSFTSKPIAQALITAKNKGIDVRIILDARQLDNRSQYALLKEASLPILTDSTVAASHNKVMIIDAEKVLTGSYNWTNAAENRNAENLLLIENKDLAQTFLQSWQNRKTQILERAEKKKWG